MGVFDIICGALLIITSILVIVVVSMQEGKGGLGAIAGETADRVGKNYGRTMDAMLAKVTKYLTAIFFVVTLVANFLNIYLK